MAFINDQTFSSLNASLNSSLDFRESAIPRVFTSVLMTTIGGFYTGTTILSKAL